MEKHGWRFIYNANSGDIVFSEGQASGDLLSRKPWDNLKVLEFEYDELDLSKHDISHVAIETGKLVLIERPSYETDEQKRIRELEDELLLQAENEIGGIL